MEKVEKSLIIVEDEPLISIMIEEMATDLGWNVEGQAYSEADAFVLLESCRPNVALLDINLGTETSLAVASHCQDIGIPVVFVTGYTARDIPPLCGDWPVLAKPFSPEDLGRVLQRSLAPSQGASTDDTQQSGVSP